MVLQAMDVREVDLDRLAAKCKVKTIWTIDLAYLLREYHCEVLPPAEPIHAPMVAPLKRIFNRFLTLLSSLGCHVPCLVLSCLAEYFLSTPLCSKVGEVGLSQRQKPPRDLNSHKNGSYPSRDGSTCWVY